MAGFSFLDALLSGSDPVDAAWRERVNADPFARYHAILAWQEGRGPCPYDSPGRVRFAIFQLIDGQELPADLAELTTEERHAAEQLAGDIEAAKKILGEGAIHA